jgi:YidC/Oxa1 family membrane protein insertase
MEQKKFDFTSFIGMILLGGIILWMMNTNQPEPTQDDPNTPKTEVSDSIKTTNTNVPTNMMNPSETDSIKNAALQSQFGLFAYSAMNGKEGSTTIENDLLRLEISNKGGQIIEAQLKQFQTYDSLPLHLIKNNNASFNINFGTTDNRILNTKDLFFIPELTQNGENQVLSMKLKVSETQYLEYRYEMKPNEYMVDFAVRSQGLSSVINSSNEINLDWDLTAFRNEKSRYTENMYSCLNYKADGEVDDLSASDTEVIESLSWVGYKQHFFSSVLMAENKPFENGTLVSQDQKDEEIDSLFTKSYAFKAPLELSSGELNYELKWYYGPNDYDILSEYEGTDLNELVDLGWGIFGTINRWIFIPIFNLLSSFIGNFGLVIILMTIVVRILMSPLVYKSYVSSAKMKVIRPELNELNKKYPGKDNALKRQQETMAVQRKAGVSMMSGCIPALLQMPIFFALFRFFPSNITLRGESFLWAEDLSSYDTIFMLPFDIPFYGNHVSLFPILASVAIFFYMRMNQSQQMNMQAPTQEGMPDMGKLMKYMIYFSPIMMLFFFNNYASSLSLYYFVSNLLTIAIMLVIKNYVIDEKKIIAQIEENKKRPEKKKSKFRQRLDDAMKQAQEQQNQRKK